MKTKSLVGMVMSFALAACSDSPSVSDARAKLENRIQQQSNGLIKLVSFDKTDGVMHEMGGVKEYEMSYAAEVEFLDDVMWSGGNNLSGWDGSFFAQRGTPQPPQNVFGRFMDLNQGMKGAKKGEHLKFTGTLVLDRTERGWH
jgi:hypothetical protein